VKKIKGITPAGCPTMEVRDKDGGFLFVGEEGVKLAEVCFPDHEEAQNAR
jgi:hypothetical protein